MSELLTQAETFLQQAIEAHKEFSGYLTKAKVRAFDCGVLLLSASELCQERGAGSWEDLLKSQDQIARTTAFRYMRFAKDCLEWAVEQNPQLAKIANPTKRLELMRSTARDLVLESALSFMELAREVGLIRQREGGGHRSAKRQNGEPQQQWFSFDVFYDLTWSLKNQKYEALRTVEPERLVQAKTELEAVIAEINKVLTSDPQGSPSPLGRGQGEGQTGSSFLSTRMGSIPQNAVAI